MFGLPLETTLLVFGFPLFWVIYTAIFLYRTRRWRDDDTVEDDGS
jgi:hypothetical protein